MNLLLTEKVDHTPIKPILLLSKCQAVYFLICLASRLVKGSNPLKYLIFNTCNVRMVTEQPSISDHLMIDNLFAMNNIYISRYMVYTTSIIG